MMEPRWRMLALDYDRTLVEPGQPPSAKVVAALRRARQGGILVAVCSGQPFGLLQAALPPVDGVAAENGAVVWVRGDGQPARHAWPAGAGLAARLRARGVPVREFEVILSLPRACEPDLAALDLHGHGASAVRNVDTVNLQPEGVDKGTGLTAIQARLGVTRPRTVAVGDGENDVALFREAGLALAVAGAAKEAAAAARLQLDLADGAGVCAVVDAMLGVGPLQPELARHLGR